MIVDHLGLFFFPNHILFRVIGRLSFPLFAWLLANGAHHTKNIKLYLIRIFIFASVSQFPFILANRQIDPSFWYLNVLFTLFLGLLAVSIIKATTHKFFWFLATFVCVIAANLLRTDYGAAGVLSIISFFLFYEKTKYIIISQVLILLILPLTTFSLEVYLRISLASYYMDSIIEPFGLFSLFFIVMYNGQEGPKAKYLFYYFYPLQYGLIFFLNLLS